MDPSGLTVAPECAWDGASGLGTHQQALGRSAAFALPADPGPEFLLGAWGPGTAMLDAGVWGVASGPIQDGPMQTRLLRTTECRAGPSPQSQLKVTFSSCLCPKHRRPGTGAGLEPRLCSRGRPGRHSVDYLPQFPHR